MDEYLLEYLRSGSAWLLVGSGPSAAVGYPSWKKLASAAIELCKEALDSDHGQLLQAFERGNYPGVFEQASTLVGTPRLLQHLSKILPVNPTGSPGKNVYSHLAKWPIPVYLTTNFDNEILRHLALSGESTFIDYANNPDHLSALLPETSGVVVSPTR